ncbi:MAG: hypothetical protein KAT00_04930 [Planctomycetes bacterium]|nr:hypothetical protein [Planctomycetota bacterium]
MFWHDPGAQIAQGVVLTVDEARVHWSAGSLPQFCVFRGEGVEAVAQLAVEVGDLTLCIDELDQACREKRWLSPTTQAITQYSRHYRVDLFGSFRATRNVSEDLLAQSDYVFLLRHNPSSIYDIRTIEARFGEHYANIVANLEPKHFVIWSDD